MLPGTSAYLKAFSRRWQSSRFARAVWSRVRKSLTRLAAWPHHERVAVGLPAVEDPGLLQPALQHVGYFLFPVDHGDRAAGAPRLLHQPQLGARHGIARVVQPFAHQYPPVAGRAVGGARLEPLLDERVGKQS